MDPTQTEALETSWNFEAGFKKPIPRPGESEFAAIVRSQSESDYAEVTHVVRWLKDLPKAVQQEVCDSAWHLYLCVCSQTGLRAEQDPNQSREENDE